MKSAIIINPFSGGGRTAKMWRTLRDRVKSSLGGTLEEVSTRAPMEAARFAAQISHSGYDLLIIAGGDGTINEAVNGLFAEDGVQINPNLMLAVLSAGRGCDFIKSARIPEDPEKAAQLLVNPQSKKIDLGLCFFKDEFGRDKRRYFVNIASAGVAGRVARQVSHTPRFLPPGAAYYSAVVTHFLTYNPQRVKVSVDGQEVFDGPAINTFVANGRYSGAGMCWAPPARIDDGIFDVVIAEPMPKLTTLLQQHKVYSGEVLEVPGINHFRGKEVMVESQDDVLLEIDGEQPGLVPAVFKILPSCLNLVQAV